MDAQRSEIIMAWQLNTIDSRNGKNWKQDTSGLYTTIHYYKGVIRVDIFDNANNPIESFQSIAEDIDFLRRATIDFLQTIGNISAEHISYIGAELMRAVFEKAHYTQN